MAGKEFNFSKDRTLQIAAKAIYTGGRRYTPANEVASQQIGAYIEDFTRPFGAAGPNYFRLDTRIAFRKNTKKLAYEISLDLQNATNNQNVQTYTFDRKNSALIPRYQASLTPIVAFRLDF